MVVGRAGPAIHFMRKELRSFGAFEEGPDLDLGPIQMPTGGVSGELHRSAGCCPNILKVVSRYAALRRVSHSRSCRSPHWREQVGDDQYIPCRGWSGFQRDERQVGRWHGLPLLAEGHHWGRHHC